MHLKKSYYRIVPLAALLVAVVCASAWADDQYRWRDGQWVKVATADTRETGASGVGGATSGQSGVAASAPAGPPAMSQLDRARLVFQQLGGGRLADAERARV
jgi:hypothetical protein